MRSFFSGLVLVASIAFCGHADASIVIDFDNAANWSSGGTLSSYRTDHVYADQGMVFTGGPALRETIGTQDGFPRTFGAFSWRMNQLATVSWTATLADASAMPTFDTFSFAVRRWDSAPDTNFVVAYSLNGGTDFTTAGTINNAFLDNSSDWKTFSFNLGTTSVGNGDFVLRLAAAGTTERIMVDNFSLTAVPEPGSFAVLGVLSAAGFVVRRRRSKKAALLA